MLVYLPGTDQILWLGPEVFVGRTMLHLRLWSLHETAKRRAA